MATLIGAITIPTPAPFAIFRNGNDNELSWSAKHSKVQGWRIERQLDGGGFSTLTTKSPEERTHVDASVTTEGVYDYRVVGYRGGRDGTPSETRQVTVGAGGESLLQFSDLTHEGSFRVELTGYDDGLEGISYNPANNSLFACGHNINHKVGEISIPGSLSFSTTYSSLPNSSVIQALRTVAPPDLNGLPGQGQWYVRGTMVHGDDLICTILLGYDASSTMTKSHMRFVGGATNLAGATQEGMFRIGTRNPAFYAGGIATIPAAHQADFGNKTHICGTTGMSIISRSSLGPAIAGFDPDDLGVTTAPVAEMCCYPYSSDLSTALANPGSSNDLYTHVSIMRGLVWPDGYDCVLCFGSHGKGDNIHSPGIQYGSGTSNSSLAGTPVGDGDFYRYDPCISAKGYHAYPYKSKMWAYRKSDLKAVYDGTVDPWSIAPYATADFDMPITACNGALGGVAHDPATRRLYFSTPSIASFGRRGVHVYSYPAP